MSFGVGDHRRIARPAHLREEPIAPVRGGREALVLALVLVAVLVAVGAAALLTVVVLAVGKGGVSDAVGQALLMGLRINQ
ncbi:hypothetical protein [Cryptosporangium phraense]|uniref:hypothetical protein n=1 Tax=Cryptosporangium phraense TaxID=2593070 RepID=UPI0014787174|nr:hypothetical protein [Cryptosporangium phraense]